MNGANSYRNKTEKNNDQFFDYIIAGAGCAGLSLAIHMIHSGKFSESKILLIDKKIKTDNDRTWCFWEDKPGIFESIVVNRWSKIKIINDEKLISKNIRPFEYKLIKAIDYYNYCLTYIESQPNFFILYEKIDHIFSGENTTGIVINDRTFYCTYLFNSILFEKPELNAKNYWLLQHFKGWVIETENDSFDIQTATLMDFRGNQENTNTFYYVLPFSNKKALVEYTVFSERLLTDEQYNAHLKKYISDILKLDKYEILDEEIGAIPMTNFKFSARQNNIINIGTAGGQTRGSTGYTFNFIQRHSEFLVNHLIAGKLKMSNYSKRFAFYDSIFLNVLVKKIVPGETIFMNLFSKNNPYSVFRFMDKKSSIFEDLKIISALPFRPFLKAAFNYLF